MQAPITNSLKLQCQFSLKSLSLPPHEFAGLSFPDTKIPNISLKNAFAFATIRVYQFALPFITYYLRLNRLSQR